MDSPFSDTVPKLSVSELTTLIKTTLETSFYGLTVEGEISGFRPASTGHWYFSLKDQNAVIGCCMWRSSIPRVAFKPKDGMRVIVTGSIVFALTLLKHGKDVTFACHPHGGTDYEIYPMNCI